MNLDRIISESIQKVIKEDYEVNLDDIKRCNQPLGNYLKYIRVFSGIRDLTIQEAHWGLEHIGVKPVSSRSRYELFSPRSIRYFLQVGDALENFTKYILDLRRKRKQP